MPTVPPETVVVTVGDQKITAEQFDQIVQSLPPQFQANARGAGRKQFADNLVRVLVLSQEGKRRKLDESTAYKVQSQFQNSNMLAGITYDQIGKDAKLDDAEMHKYYEEHKGEFERVHARHILVRAQGSPLPVKPGQKDLTEAEALAKILELRQKIVEGGDFAALARVESDDMGSSAKGGDVGFINRGQTVPSFEEALFSLPDGALSQPVKSTYGYHLIKVEERKPTKTFEELRPELQKKVENEASRKFLSDLKAKAKIVIDPEFSGSPQPAVEVKAGSKPESK